MAEIRNVLHRLVHPTTVRILEGELVTEEGRFIGPKSEVTLYGWGVRMYVTPQENVTLRERCQKTTDRTERTLSQDDVYQNMENLFTNQIFVSSHAELQDNCFAGKVYDNVFDILCDLPDAIRVNETFFACDGTDSAGVVHRIEKGDIIHIDPNDNLQDRTMLCCRMEHDSTTIQLSTSTKVNVTAVMDPNKDKFVCFAGDVLGHNFKLPKEMVFLDQDVQATYQVETGFAVLPLRDRSRFCVCYSDADCGVTEEMDNDLYKVHTLRCFDMDTTQLDGVTVQITDGEDASTFVPFFAKLSGRDDNGFNLYTSYGYRSTDCDYLKPVTYQNRTAKVSGKPCHMSPTASSLGQLPALLPREDAGYLQAASLWDKAQRGYAKVPPLPRRGSAVKEHTQAPRTPRNNTDYDDLRMSPPSRENTLKNYPQAPPPPKDDTLKTYPQASPPPKDDTLKSYPQASPPPKDDTLKTYPQASPPPKDNTLKSYPQASPPPKDNTRKIYPQAPPPQGENTLKSYPQAPPPQGENTLKTYPQAQQPPTRENKSRVYPMIPQPKPSLPPARITQATKTAAKSEPLSKYSELPPNSVAEISCASSGPSFGPSVSLKPRKGTVAKNTLSKSHSLDTPPSLAPRISQRQSERNRRGSAPSSSSVSEEDSSASPDCQGTMTRNADTESGLRSVFTDDNKTDELKCLMTSDQRYATSAATAVIAEQGIEEMTISDLVSLFRTYKLDNVANTCAEYFIDGTTLLCLNEDDLKDEPFNLTGFVLVRVKQLLKGHRPK